VLYATAFFAVQIVSVLAVFASINGFSVISSDDSGPQSAEAEAPAPRLGFVDRMSFACGLTVLIPNFFLAAARVVFGVSML
jgi:hypothetical protein